MICYSDNEGDNVILSLSLSLSLSVISVKFSESIGYSTRMKRLHFSAPVSVPSVSLGPHGTNGQTDATFP